MNGYRKIYELRINEGVQTYLKEIINELEWKKSLGETEGKQWSVIENGIR